MKSIKRSALARIDTLDMLSSDGWRRVREACGHIDPDADEMTLADGFIEFQSIWYDDNEIEGELPESIDQTLLSRYVDYLLGD